MDVFNDHGHKETPRLFRCAKEKELFLHIGGVALCHVRKQYNTLCGREGKNSLDTVEAPNIFCSQIESVTVTTSDQQTSK